jgi:hypothetical protein
MQSLYYDVCIPALSSPASDHLLEMISCVVAAISGCYSRSAQTIFRRDKGVCQVRLKCSGQDFSWDNWKADHKLPWSHGGKTTVENGPGRLFGVQRFKGRDYAASRLMWYFNLLPDTRPFSLPRSRSGKNALKRFRRRGASA